MNLGFGSYSFSALFVIRNIAFQLLKELTVDQIVDTGNSVSRLLETFRLQHPEQVPTCKSGGGLLNVPISTVPVADFELARHLIDTNHPDMASVVNGANGVPVMLAYVATMTSGSESPAEHFLESALPFVVQSLSVDAEVSKRWSESLRAENQRLASLADTGAKFTTGRKPQAVGPLARAVRKHLKDCRDDNPEAVWVALAAHPPKGMTFQNNRQGRYVEFDKRTFKGNLKNSDYRNFANTVYRERKRLLGCID